MKVEPEFLLLFSLCYLFFGGVLTSAVLVAVCVHEVGHLLMIQLVGGEITGIQCCGSGVEIGYQAFNASCKDLLCAAAGPFLGTACTLLAYTQTGRGEFWEMLFRVSFVLNAWNLLPVLPMDGGRILYFGVSIVASEKKAEMVCAVAFWLTEILLVLLMFSMLFYAGSFILIPAVGSLLIYGCKMSVSGVKSIL